MDISTPPNSPFDYTVTFDRPFECAPRVSIVVANKIDPDFVLLPDGSLEYRPETEKGVVDAIDWLEIGHEPDLANSKFECECGAESVGSDRHDSWCKKWEG